jgi:glutathione S-transferase
MSEVVLFHAPEACSRVTMNALEEIGVPFEDRAINIFSGEQKSPQYLSLNPKGKVPALQIDGVVHKENAAILYYLHSRFASAQLLPQPGGTVAENEPLEDLVWCSSTIHPMVRQVRTPMRFTTGDPSGVKSMECNSFRDFCSGLRAVWQAINSGTESDGQFSTFTSIGTIPQPKVVE